MKGFSYLKNVATLQLASEICIGCGICIQVCPHQVFTVDAGKAHIVNGDACMECGACAMNCPVTAIAVDSGVGCASGLVTEWLRKFRSSHKSGECC